MIRNFILLILAIISIAGNGPLWVHTNVSERFIESSCTKLFCRTKGEGKPLVILHGGPGLTQDYLLPQMYKLAENNFVIFYDQRGCGKSISEINSETISIDTYIDDLDTLRQAFGFNKISILGHSWGTFLAMHYAIAYPEHVDKLILSNVHPANSEEYSQFEKEWHRRMEPYKTKMDELYNSQAFQNGDPGVVEQYYRLEFRQFCYNPEKAGLLNLYMSPIASINCLKVHGIFSKNVFQKFFDLHPSLKKLHIPTLIVHGDTDPIPPSIAKNVHDDIEGSQYILMKNCGHFPYVEAPDEYFKYIENFMK